MDINKLKEMSRNSEEVNNMETNENNNINNNESLKEENKMQGTNQNNEEVTLQDMLDNPELAGKNLPKTPYNNLAFGEKGQTQKYAPLPESPKDKAMVFFNNGVGTLFRTIEFNQNTNWNEKEYNIIYGAENSIIIKTIEIKELVDSLKVEIDISAICKKLEETRINWLDITPVGDGLFEMRNKKTGKVISTKNAEITISTIETLAQMEV